MQIQYETELYHHGIKGQKWGVRRFQDATTGTLTQAGRDRYREKVQGKIADYQKKHGVNKETATRTVIRREQTKNFFKATAGMTAGALAIALGPVAWSAVYANTAIELGPALAGLIATKAGGYGAVGMAVAKNSLSEMTLEEINDVNIRAKASNVAVS